MSQLSNKNIELLERFIETHSPSETMPSLPETYRESAIIEWEEISDPHTVPTSYYIFASASNGMTSFGFYKSKNNKIYIVKSFCNELTDYYNVDSEWSFLKTLQLDYWDYYGINRKCFSVEDLNR